MEESASLTLKNDPESDSNWSDINSEVEEDIEDCEKSLKIVEDEDTEISTGVKKSPPRRHSFVKFTATSGSSKKSRMHRQKRKIISKKRLGLKKIDVPEEIQKESQGLESVEKIAEKLHMNRTQVKSVLRELAETPELFSLGKFKNFDQFH